MSPNHSAHDDNNKSEQATSADQQSIETSKARRHTNKKAPFELNEQFAVGGRIVQPQMLTSALDDESGFSQRTLPNLYVTEMCHPSSSHTIPNGLGPNVHLWCIMSPRSNVHLITHGIIVTHVMMHPVVVRCNAVATNSLHVPIPSACPTDRNFAPFSYMSMTSGRDATLVVRRQRAQLPKHKTMQN